MKYICKHCGQDIIKVGSMYHEIGAKVFPQYCSTFHTGKRFADN